MSRLLFYARKGVKGRLRESKGTTTIWETVVDRLVREKREGRAEAIGALAASLLDRLLAHVAREHATPLRDALWSALNAYLQTTHTRVRAYGYA